MTAREALDAANDTEPRERLRRYATICDPRGTCNRQPCERDAGRWSACATILVVTAAEALFHR